MKALKNVMLFSFCVLLVSMLGLSLQTDVKGARRSGDYIYESIWIGARIIKYMRMRDSYTIKDINIDIPKTLDGQPVVEIGREAFCNCNMREVTIPNSVVAINNGAFYDCLYLAKVTIPNSVKVIGDRAFWGCHSLTEVVIPPSVTEIGEGAFCDCRSLKKLTILYGVASINNRAFFNCGSLTSVSIPSSVTNIGEEAFADCRELEEVTMMFRRESNIAANAFLKTPWDDKIYKLSIRNILLPPYLPPLVYNGLYQAPIYGIQYPPQPTWNEQYYRPVDW